MSPHISYHPFGNDTIRRYVGYLSTPDAAALAAADYDSVGAHERFRPAFVEMASQASALTGSFDETHGLNLAITQGFFGSYHYLHDARLTALGDLLLPYTQTWHEMLPTWPVTESAMNRLGSAPSSGVVIAADRLGQFMNDAHTDPALQAGLALQFPGDKLAVLWAALTAAYESGKALLEASGVIELDPADITRSTCRTNQTNCDPAGIRLYLASAPAPPAGPAPPVVHEHAAAAAAASTAAAPPVADPATVGQMEWEPAVVMLGNAHDARSDLVMGPGGFLESWSDGDGLMALTHPAAGLGMALWFDWKEDYLVEQRCRAMADWRIGWPDNDFARMHELQFTWDGSSSSGHVDQGLLAFDEWLVQRGRGMRLISVQTNGDFYVSFLYPEADAYRFIQALGSAGVQASMQDGTMPTPQVPAAVEPAPERKVPGAPSLAERMRQRSTGF